VEHGALALQNFYACEAVLPGAPISCSPALYSRDLTPDAASGRAGRHHQQTFRHAGWQFAIHLYLHMKNDGAFPRALSL